MEFEDEEERFLLYGVSYTEAEVLEARSIRTLTDGEEKINLISAFEKRVKKTFPAEEPTEYGFNTAACLDSRVIDRSVSYLMCRSRESRTRLPL